MARRRNRSLTTACSENEGDVDVFPLLKLTDELLCYIVRLSENAQGCAGTHSRLMSAVLRSRRAGAADRRPEGVELSGIRSYCSLYPFVSFPRSFGVSTKLTLHVNCVNPRHLQPWFMRWSLRLRPAKDTHALHLELKRDTIPNDEWDIMDMLKWVLHGVQDAVQVITIDQMHAPMFLNGTEVERLFSQLTHLRSLILKEVFSRTTHKEAGLHLLQCLIRLPQLHDLVLSMNGLDAKDLEALEPAWKHLPVLQSLDLSGNDFSLDAAFSMAIALRSLTALTFLSLSRSCHFGSFNIFGLDGPGDNNPINQINIPVLSLALSGLSQLRTLDISYSSIAVPSWCAALAGAINNLTALQRLNLVELHLSLDADIFYPAVLSGLTGLQHLNMSGFAEPTGSFYTNTEGFASVFGTLTSLRYLDLSDDSIGQRSLIESPHFVLSLQALTRLERLNLGCCLFDDPDEFINEIQLEKDFYYTALEGMRFNLRSLDVSGHTWMDREYATDFSNALKCFKHTLQHLNLSYCLQHLPLESIIIIATALRGLERLQSIDLSCNSISASSMGVLGLSLGYLTTLRALDLSSNRDLLSEDGASHISAALTKLTGLTFLGMSYVSSGLSLAGVQQLRVLTPSLAALTKLEWLDLGRSVFLSSEEIASSVLAPALRQLSTLTQLTVRDCKMDTGFADDYANNESLVVRAVLSEAISHMPACKLR